MSFDLLSHPIRKYIRDKQWEELRPIQHAAISRILATENNYILISRTASGKTEAAFLPILSKVNFQDPGVQVLYISPLIALINDQFNRVEELCKYLDVTVTKWHGEAKRSQKDQLLREPSGIVLTTPESLEAMFVNKPFNIQFLFGNLKYIVIDEIHSFVGTDRGTQLMSILHRLQEQNRRPVNIVGLSATVSEENSFQEVKLFTGNHEKTKVLIDRAPKEIAVSFRYFDNNKMELPDALLEDIYLETKDSKALIFPNRRGLAEEVAVKLQKISARQKGHSNHFSHHSSVDREVREYVEYFAKNNKRQNFTISCTSTLELGIDIGSVDKVIQIDAAHSIASLIQRTGRSGRRNNEKSSLLLFSTNPWSLLQSIASWRLYTLGFVEPPPIIQKPYHIFLHQILSITKEHSGINLDILTGKLASNAAFSNISSSDTISIIDHLISTDLLERLGNEVIIGITGEKVVNNREFYSVFETEENFKVINAGNNIGDVPLSPQIREGENILLAARIWKIKFVDLDAKKIDVVKANDGKPPKFSGGGGDVHVKIREEMLKILCSEEDIEHLDPVSVGELKKLRADFAAFDLKNIESDRPMLVKEGRTCFYTFASSRVNRTLYLLFHVTGVEAYLSDSECKFEFECSKNELLDRWRVLTGELEDINDHLRKLINDDSSFIKSSKWSEYLPIKYQLELLKEKQYDVFATLKFLEETRFVEAIDE